MKITMEKGVNIVVIAVCLIVIGRVGVSIRKSTRPPSAPNAGEQLQTSDRIALGLQGATQTLMLVTASTCRYCAASMPFYQKLAPVAQDCGTRLVAVTTEDADTNAEYLATHGLRPAMTIEVSQLHFAIPGTPVLILAGGNGKIVKSWTGLLDSARESSVLSTIRSGCNRRVGNS